MWVRINSVAKTVSVIIILQKRKTISQTFFNVFVLASIYARNNYIMEIAAIKVQ